MRLLRFIYTLGTLFVFLFIACNQDNSDLLADGTQSTIDSYQQGIKEVRVLARSETPAPRWIFKQWEDEFTEGSNSSIFLTVKVIAGSLNVIDAYVDADFEAEIYNAVYLYTLDQLMAMEIGLSNKPVMSEHYSDIASELLEIDELNIVFIDDYWEYLQEKDEIYSENYFRYFRQFSMNAVDYMDMIGNNISSAKKEVPAEYRNQFISLMDEMIAGYSNRIFAE